MKVISKKKMATYEKVRILEREIEIHQDLNHPNTVPLYEVMQTNTEVCGRLRVKGGPHVCARLRW